MEECFQSMGIVRQALDALKKIPSKSPADFKGSTIYAVEGKATTYLEAPRGRLQHNVVGNNTPIPQKVQITTPTMLNIQTLPHILKGYSIADIPPIVMSLDPCFGCCDRLIVIDEKSGRVINDRSI
jgi:Ni,Fe-hydrogenase III large subunit